MCNRAQALASNKGAGKVVHLGVATGELHRAGMGVHLGADTVVLQGAATGV